MIVRTSRRVQSAVVSCMIAIISTRAVVAVVVIVVVVRSRIHMVYDGWVVLLCCSKQASFDLFD